MAAPRQFKMMPSGFKTGGVVRFMVEAEGYVMVRRPGCTAFVVNAKTWESWPDCHSDGTEKAKAKQGAQ
jgi:hypothetical protein